MQESIQSQTRFSLLRRGFIGLSALTLSFMSGLAHADDIEIYEAIFNAQQATGGIPTNNPNVLFILDNSLSMDDYRLVQEGSITTSDVYDPNAIYGGSTRDDNVYLYSSPSGGSTEPLGTYQGISISTAQNDCQAARDAFAADPDLPIHQDQYIQWTRYNNGRYGWTISYFNSNNNRRSFECEDDNGVHGRTNGSNARYPRICSSGTQTCTSNSGNSLYRDSQQYRNGAEWPYDFFSNEFIMVDGNYHQFLQGAGNSQTASASDCSYNDQILQDTALGVEFRCLQKLEIMKRALTNVVEGDPTNPDQNGIVNVNMGLMRFNYNAYDNDIGSTRHGGTIVDAVEPAAELTSSTSDAADRTNRDDFVDKVDDMEFEGNTPLAESMYEAYRYFAGWSPHNAEHTPRPDVSNQDTLDNAAVVDGFVGTSSTDETYKSPLTTNQCQGNYVVVLSDGEPTADTDENTRIQNINGISSCSGNCLDEVAGALKDNLGVHTYTIGFEADIDILEEAAFAGSPENNPTMGDGYFLANDLDSLESVFTNILSEIQAVENDSFVAPAVTVNAFNRLQNRQDIYYAVFAPQNHPRWAGNIKKYRVEANATITDQNGLDSISPDTGFFTDESQSFWSDTVDGPNVEEGGFISELTVPRKIYGNLDTNSTAVTYLSAADIDTALTNFTNAVLNLDATGAVVGLLDSLIGGTITGVGSLVGGIFGGNGGTPQASNLANILLWTLGQDIDGDRGGAITDPARFAGESIHSTPFVLSYGSSDTEPKDIVFMVSNQGMLHAITGAGSDEPLGSTGDVGGSERWAYIPDPDLLKNLGGYYNKELNGSEDHIYGLDGEIASLVERNASNVLTKAHLFISQRRGGNKMFAVDVSNAYSPTNPISKLWTVTGGVGDLERLGQTWSKPVVAALDICDTSGTCSRKDVLVLGGGYDTDYDDSTRSISGLSDDASGQDTMGNAIYILDAETGDVLWVASNSLANVRTGTNDDVVVAEMDHSIPSSPTVLDIDKDGSLDTIFAVDVSGQIFRFDFTMNAAGNDLSVTGGRIANLQESGTNRRFYNSVDAVILPNTTDGAANRIALVTGSGYRAHPLEVEGFANRFYVIYDENILGAAKDSLGAATYSYVPASASTYRPILASDLSAVDDNNPLAAGTTHKYGYYTNLLNTTSEKILNPTLISNFRVVAVSYTPSTATTNLCSSAAGSSMAYRLNLQSGSVATVPLAKPGVSAAPVLVDILNVDATSGDETLEPIVIIGTEPFDAEETFEIPSRNLGKAKKRAWWEVGRQ